MAGDQGCCFSGGLDLTPRLADIEHVKNSALFGMFPAFVPRVRQEYVETAIARLGELQEDAVAGIIQSVPLEWEVDADTRRVWRELICGRAVFVVENILPQIARVCWPDQFFDKKS